MSASTIKQFKESHHFNIAANLTLNTMAGFLSGFGPRGGKTAICNLVGGGGAWLSQHAQHLIM